MTGLILEVGRNQFELYNRRTVRDSYQIPAKPTIVNYSQGTATDTRRHAFKINPPHMSIVRSARKTLRSGLSFSNADRFYRHKEYNHAFLPPPNNGTVGHVCSLAGEVSARAMMNTYIYLHDENTVLL